MISARNRGLLALVPLSVLFAINALSFLASAALLAGLSVVRAEASGGFPRLSERLGREAARLGHMIAHDDVVAAARA